MKTILSSRKHRYLARVSIFLIAVALIAGMVGCTEPTGYELTIDSKAGGSVIATIDGKKTVIDPGKEKTISDIPEDTEVDLVATPGADYRFVSWTGDVATIANANYASTTIIMNGRYSTIHYSIKAEFVQGQEIEDWNDLRDISLDGSHVLMYDLNYNTAGYDKWVDPDGTDGLGWEPIKIFVGTFDGQGHEIRDLFIHRPDKFGVGLFSYVDVGGKIKDLGVVNANVTGNGSVGGLVGWNRGTVRDSYSTGTVTGSGEYVGGLVGWNEGTEENGGTVENSYSSSNVTGSNKYVGGLVGWNQGTVSSSNSTGYVTGSNKYVGGLVGYNKCGTVTNSHSSGNVIGSDEHVGGLVGWNEGTKENGGTVENSYSTGNVKGNAKVGGLVGFNNHDSKVSKSHSTGNVTSEEGSDIGGLVGWNEGAVEKSHSTGEVTGKTNVGGLVGENVYTIEKSYSTGSVTGEYCVGGLVGENRGTVSSSNSTGSVTGEDHVGGLVGHNDDIVKESYATGSVTGEDYVGGLVGENDDTVKESYATGSVTGEYCVGGLVGENDDTVKESYSTGSVNGSTYSRRVGGLIGYNYGGTDSVDDSYSTGSVSGYRYVGGLVGYNEQSDVIMCYSTGTVNGTDDAGGLVGVNNGEEDDVRNCFWDTKTSGQATSDGGTGKTTAEMMDIATFTAVDWFITAVLPGKTDDYFTWNIDIDKQRYPFLGWQSV